MNLFQRAVGRIAGCRFIYNQDCYLLQYTFFVSIEVKPSTFLKSIRKYRHLYRNYQENSSDAAKNNEEFANDIDIF